MSTPPKRIFSLIFLFSLSISESEGFASYYGKTLGSFHHSNGMSGDVYVADQRTFLILNFKSPGPGCRTFMAAPREAHLFPSEMLDETGTGLNLPVKYRLVTNPLEETRVKRDSFVPQLFSVSDFFNVVDKSSNSDMDGLVSVTTTKATTTAATTTPTTTQSTTTAEPTTTTEDRFAWRHRYFSTPQANSVRPADSESTRPPVGPHVYVLGGGGGSRKTPRPQPVGPDVETSSTVASSTTFGRWGSSPGSPSSPDSHSPGSHVWPQRSRNSSRNEFVEYKSPAVSTPQKPAMRITFGDAKVNMPSLREDVTYPPWFFERPRNFTEPTTTTSTTSTTPTSTTPIQPSPPPFNPEELPVAPIFAANSQVESVATLKPRYSFPDISVPETTTPKYFGSPFDLPQSGLDYTAMVQLPELFDLTQFKWIGIFDHCKKEIEGNVEIPADFLFPREALTPGIRGPMYNTSSSPIRILNCNTLVIQNFTYLGTINEGAFFYVGYGEFPGAILQKVQALVEGEPTNKPLETYRNRDVTVKLPNGWRTFDIEWLAVINPWLGHSYGYAPIPKYAVPPCENLL